MTSVAKVNAGVGITKINTTDLANGMYVLNVSTAQGVQQQSLWLH